jgi:hypothetical protein
MSKSKSYIMSTEIEIRVPLQNESVKLKRKVAVQIRNGLGLNFHPILVDLVSTTHMTTDAVRVRAKLTEQNGKCCRLCNKTLKTDLAMMVGIGSTCSKYLGVNYPVAKEQVEDFRKSIDQKVQELGEFEFWLPKKQIKEYVKGHRLKFLAEKFYK